MKITMYVQNGLGAVNSAPIPVKKEAVWTAVGSALSAVGSLLGANQTNQANASLNEQTRIWQGRQNRLAEEFAHSKRHLLD